MQPSFRGYDPHRPLTIYVRSLPHWRQDGATYFVTFRLGDSIPRGVLAEWLDARARFLVAHGIDSRSVNRDNLLLSERYRKIPKEVRRVFERKQARMLHEELDRCHGACALRTLELRNELLAALQLFHGERYWLGDCVVMPNHVHAIVQPFSSFQLESLIGSTKKWVARRFREQNRSDKSGRLWQSESYDRIVRDCKELGRYRRYIANNPIKARLAPSEFSYFCASWLDEYARIT